MKFKKGIAFLFAWIIILSCMLLAGQICIVWKRDASAIDNVRRLLNNPTRDRDVNMVLILTYMRSGSSLIGDILQQSPGAFFVYEPLRFLSLTKLQKDGLDYVNGTLRPSPFDFNEEAVGIFKNWFTCNIMNLPSDSLKDKYFLGRGLKTKLFHACLRRRKKGTLLTFQSCVKDLQRRCEESPVRILKTIRVELSTIKHLLEELPNLKIIHLVRDPRATIFSQAQLAVCNEKHGGFQGCINKYCTSMENDVVEGEWLKQEHPGRIMTVFYENIARHPIEASREMYDFCGTEFSDNAYKYVYNITMAGNPDNCAICTVRSNSSEHIDTWKRKMSPEILNMIQERCNYILKRYKYI